MTRNQFKDRLRTFGWECFEKYRLENELLARYRDAQPRHKTKPIEDELTYIRTRIALTKEILGLMEPDDRDMVIAVCTGKFSGKEVGVMRGYSLSGVYTRINRVIDAALKKFSGK